MTMKIVGFKHPLSNSSAESSQTHNVLLLPKANDWIYWGEISKEMWSSRHLGECKSPTCYPLDHPPSL